MIALSLIILVTITLFVIIDSRFLGIGWASNSVGLCYVSEVYTPNDNISYAVSFHEVNFTFMYWTYPRSGLTEQEYTAYFLIEFSDNSSEVISIRTGGYWYAAFPGNTRPIRAETTIDTSPIAGVLYHGYLDCPVGWRFIVRLFN
jgi:hypothetical protein